MIDDATFLKWSDDLPLPFSGWWCDGHYCHRDKPICRTNAWSSSQRPKSLLGIGSQWQWTIFGFFQHLCASRNYSETTAVLVLEQHSYSGDAHSRKIMSEYRFSLITTFLHFTNNDNFNTTTHPSPKLKKIWEVYQALLRNFQKVYLPGHDLSIDESLMQNAPDLVSSFFYLMWLSNGIHLEHHYVHWQGDRDQRKIWRLWTLHIVCSKSRRRFARQGLLHHPNCWSCFSNRKTDAYGTVCSNRRNLPSEFSKEKLKKGEVRAWQ